jgi:hypothetical protein
MKTSELSGAALDWAVTRANYEVNFETVWKDFREGCNYSTDWAQGGPIIEREWVSLWQVGHNYWKADKGGLYSAQSETPLIAAMRCYVASKLGDEVEIPHEAS